MNKIKTFIVSNGDTEYIMKTDETTGEFKKMFSKGWKVKEMKK